MNYENVINLNEWNLNDLKNASEYYNKELLKPHDDTEHNWLLRQIDKCNMRIDELTGNTSDWMELFK